MTNRWSIFRALAWILVSGCASTTNRPVPIASPAPAPSHPATWKSISAGESTVLGVKNDGSLWVWGWNRRGHVDRTLDAPNAQLPQSLPPTRVGTDNDWASVSVGDIEMFAMKADGTAWSWPSLDDNENAVAFPLPIKQDRDQRYREIHSRHFHTIALRTDGSLIGWGDNRHGVLGNGPSEMNVVVEMANRRWRSVATSWCLTTGIASDGTLWVWGTCDWLGQTSDHDAGTPRPVGRDSDWKQVAISGDEILALKDEGSLWTIRSGKPASEPTFGRIGQDNDWAQIGMGGALCVALRRDGSLWTWGRNDYGQLGDESAGKRDVPGRVPGDLPWRSFVAGSDYVVAESSDGTTWTWGNNRTGQLGQPRVLATLTPQRMAQGPWLFIGPGPIGLRGDNTWWAWRGITRSHPAPAVQWRSLATQYGGEVFGVQDDGSLWEIDWSTGKTRQMPNHDWHERQSQRRFAQVMGTRHGVLALDADGGLWRIGPVYVNNEKEPTMLPDRIGSSTEWTGVAARVTPAAILAKKKDNTLWLFANDRDEKPVRLGQYNWTSLAVGEHEVLGLDANGELLHFDGESLERVGRRSRWKDASAGHHHSLAVREDGTLWSWGEGKAGELGTVIAGGHESPVRIGHDSDWQNVWAGHDFSLARKTDGSLWGWGSNLDGQLGLGAPIQRARPQKLELP